MRLFIDVSTGTWGTAEDIRIVEITEYATDVVLDMLNNELSDSEIMGYGYEYGTPIPDTLF